VESISSHVPGRYALSQITAMDNNKKYKIGIDLGGTKTEIIVLTPAGDTIFRKREPTPRQPKGTDREEYKGILDFLCRFITDSAKKIPSTDFTVGIGMPGSLDRETGLVRNANTTCINGKPLQNDLEKIIKRQVKMVNDANCFTLAESLKGAAKNYRNVFGIIMGTGCGGGICIDGTVYEGRHGIEGEWGHFSIDPLGAHCFCGNRGCIETKISGKGVENAFFSRFQYTRSMKEIVDGYRKGNSHCSEVFSRFLDDFGRATGGLISILDPDAIVIGGGLSNIDELYTLGVDRIHDYVSHPHITTPILKNGLGDSAGVFGAAWIGC